MTLTKVAGVDPCHGTAGLISAVFGTKLPGPGTIYLAQDLRFLAPVQTGDTITATVTVTARQKDTNRLNLDCHCLLPIAVILAAAARG